MGGPDVTLEDVLAAARTKRVPMAAELAGYLALEIADAMTALTGEPDLSATFLSEEGVLAVHASRSGDAEVAVRDLLSRLLEVGGQQTPALAQAAKRKAPSGVRALVVELEAALIPVNRAAGRRALARLAREVNRTKTDSLRPGNAPAKPAVAPPLRAPLKRALPPVPKADPLLPPPKVPSSSSHRAVGRVTPTPPPPAAPAPGAARLPAPPRGGPAPAKPAPRGPADKLFGGDEVDNLLSSFEVTSTQETAGSVATELKAIAGLEPTPPPPGTAVDDGEGETGAPPAPVSSSPAGRGSQMPPPPPARVSTAPRSPSMFPSDPPPELASLRPSALSEDSITGVQGIDGVDNLLAMGDDAAPVPEFDAPFDPGDGGRSAIATQPPSPHATAPVAPDASEGASRKGSLEAPTLDAPVLPATPPPVWPSMAASVRDVSAPTFGREPPPSLRNVLNAPVPREKRAPKTGLALLVIALFALLTGSIAVWKLAPGFFTGRTPDKIAKERDESEKKKAEILAERAKAECKAAIVLQDIPEGAEVLLRVGQAPADVERMPMKRRLEFVLTAEGYAPKRVVVLPTAEWEKRTDGKLVHELPVELAVSALADAGAHGANSHDPWPPGEPGTEVGGAGDPGTVHISARPRGAEVWFLIGVAPEARIDRLRCDTDVEALVARGAERKRLKVTKEELAKAQPDDKGMRSVSVSAATPDAGR